MNMPDQLERLWGLNENDRILVHEGSDGCEVVVFKGEKVDKYTEFDVKIQVHGDDFDPNYTPSHPDVFNDLEVKIGSSPDGAHRLFEIIERVYEGDDPDQYIKELERMTFSEGLFPADVTVFLLQLMMIEQEINYGPGGEWTRFNPPRDLLMSCIRWIFSGEYGSLDEVISAGYNGQVKKKYQFDGENIWTRPEL